MKKEYKNIKEFHKDMIPRFEMVKEIKKFEENKELQRKRLMKKLLKFGKPIE